MLKVKFFAVVENQIDKSTYAPCSVFSSKGKGKAILSQAWTGC
jgi:hypothetical protein